jgi:hypothetical protein
MCMYVCMYPCVCVCVCVCNDKATRWVGKDRRRKRQKKKGCLFSCDSDPTYIPFVTDATRQDKTHGRPRLLWCLASGVWRFFFLFRLLASLPELRHGIGSGGGGDDGLLIRLFRRKTAFHAVLKRR